jgi:phosphatidylinositol-3-phosphatase
MPCIHPTRRRTWLSEGVRRGRGQRSEQRRRDSGPHGGTDCAHPTVGGTDDTVTAEPGDQYTNRHNPFVYFHSIIDNTAECDANGGT